MTMEIKLNQALWGGYVSRRMFKTLDSKERILNKCPLCGSELEYVDLFQYSNVYRILKNGKISKKRKFKREDGPMECGFINCSNCYFHTDCDLDTDTTGDYDHIYIHQNNKSQFIIDVD